MTFIGQVVASVLEVNDIMGEIASVADEQTQSIEPVNQALAQMDEVTQHNSERGQMSARAVRSLDRQVALLGQAVAVLSLSGSGTQTAERETRFKAAGTRRALPPRQIEPAAVQPMNTQVKHHAASKDVGEAF